MGYPTIVYGDEGLFYSDETTTKRHMLGTRGVCPDGREFVYVEMGATASVAGRMYQSEANATAAILAENPTVATAAGQTQVSVDNTATPTANDFTDGYLVDETNGHIYRVKSNTAADPTVVVIESDDGFETDLGTSDVVALYKSPFKDVIITATGASANSAPPVGVSPQVIAANAFGWLQTRGLSAVLTQGTTVIGDVGVCSTSAAGAVAAATDDLLPHVCWTLEIGANAAIGTYFLIIS